MLLFHIQSLCLYHQQLRTYIFSVSVPLLYPSFECMCVFARLASYVLQLPHTVSLKCIMCVCICMCVRTPCTVTTHQLLLRGCGVCTNRSRASVLTPVMSEVQELRGIFLRGSLPKCLPMCVCLFVCVCICVFV